MDYCDPYEGCRHVTPDCLCDDNNACTKDSCEPAIGCINISIDCDDGNADTEDICEASAGCLYRPIVEGEVDAHYE